jgi:hypothetical protein
VQGSNQARLKSTAPLKVKATSGSAGEGAGLEPGAAEVHRSLEGEGDLLLRRGRCRGPNQARLKAAAPLRVKATPDRVGEGVG